MKKTIAALLRHYRLHLSMVKAMDNGPRAYIYMVDNNLHVGISYCAFFLLGKRITNKLWVIRQNDRFGMWCDGVYMDTPIDHMVTSMEYRIAIMEELLTYRWWWSMYGRKTSIAHRGYKDFLEHGRSV